MRKRVCLACLVLVCLLCTGCDSNTNVNHEQADLTDQSVAQEDVLPAEEPEETTAFIEKEPEIQMITLKINDTEVSVQWEDNESVAALKELLKNGPKEIQMSMYGGFEQVGSLGQSLTRNDVQTVTEAGDIVLYSGNSIVVFYGSNSWAYTRLGKITDLTKQELTDLLSNGDVTLTLSLED